MTQLEADRRVIALEDRLLRAARCGPPASSSQRLLVALGLASGAISTASTSAATATATKFAQQAVAKLAFGKWIGIGVVASSLTIGVLAGKGVFVHRIPTGSTRPPSSMDSLRRTTSTQPLVSGQSAG